MSVQNRPGHRAERASAIGIETRGTANAMALSLLSADSVAGRLADPATRVATLEA
eukprot:COSAG02_NODE_15687_length_1148_cov_8.672069_2_plen_54_part_01